MRTNRLIALLIALGAIGLFAGTFVRVWQPPKDAHNDTLAAVVAANPAAPVRITIPVIGVDASVEGVGIAESGNMAVTKDAQVAAWYRLGVFPGAKGSAVINGHVVNQVGLPGVFSRLHELRAGDELFVENEAREVVRFVVEEVATYPVDAVPLERLFNGNDAARLNLITCAGEWDSGVDTFDSRVVIFARLAP